MNIAPFYDELKKGVKSLWALLLPFMTSPAASGVDSMYVPLHNKCEEGNLSFQVRSCSSS